MGTLAQHDTKIPTSGMDKTVPNASTNGAGASSRHHDEPQASHGKGGGAGLPVGRKDTAGNSSV